MANSKSKQIRKRMQRQIKAKQRHKRKKAALKAARGGAKR
jgi:hypothetical protein